MIDLYDDDSEVFYTSDWHLGHERIIELCDRPFRGVTQMNHELIDRANDVVDEQGTLVILGDVVMGIFDRTVTYLAQLRAKKIVIIPGNHDRSSLAYRHGGSPEVVRSKRELWRLRYEEARDGVVVLRDKTPSQWETMIGAWPVALSHYPYAGDSQERDRHRDLRPVDAGLPLVHGHVHGRWRTQDRMLNVGVDVNDFAPVSEGAVASWLMDLPMGAARV